VKIEGGLKNKKPQFSKRKKGGNYLKGNFVEGLFK